MIGGRIQAFFCVLPLWNLSFYCFHIFSSVFVFLQSFKLSFILVS